MLDVILARIKESKPLQYQSYIRDKADMYRQFYTGKGDYKVLTSYREKESEAQKQQRDRITIRRPVSVCHQIEHTLDKLQTLDKAVITISSRTKEDILKDYVYDNNIAKVAFNYVKYYNIVDPNAFLIAGINDFGELEFTPISSGNIFDYRIKNDTLDYLVIEDKDVFSIYLQDSVVTCDRNGIVSNTVKTGVCYAYHVGYVLDSETNFKTFKSLLSSCEQLLRQLLWDGSEYDIIKALHGIIKQFAFAQNCGYEAVTEDGVHRCNSGTIYLGDEPKGTCQVCKGSGLKIHTSNQDIVYLPEPLDNSGLKLSDLTHTVYIPDSILESRKNDIDTLETKIIRTVFNSNQNSISDSQKTAYEVKTENSGLIAQFYKLGEKVSDTFIWMCEVAGDVLGAKDVKVFHGFSMDLNLDTLEELFNQRKQAVESGTTNEVIAGIDIAILKKQHIDNPSYINQIMLWESFRPFRTLSQSEKMVAIGSSEVPEMDKILWLNWDRIRTAILFKYEDFYNMTRAQQNEIFTKEIDEIKGQLGDTRAQFKDLA